MTRGFSRWKALSAVVALLLVPEVGWALFTNGGFESNFAGWTKSNAETNGLVGPCNGPFSGINTTAGGVDQSVVVTSSPPESGVDPILTATATLRYPKYGAGAAQLNGSLIGPVAPSVVNSLTQQDTILPTDVDPVDGMYHVRFVFAPVLQVAHDPCERPFFRMRVTDVTVGSVLLYERYVFADEPGVPWKPGPAGTFTVYTDWQLVDVTSPSLAPNSIVELEITGGSCAQGAHYGYVYVDGVGSLLPGLSIVKTASTPYVAAGANLTYTFTYRNDGPTTVTNVILNETIPDCATWVSNSNPSTGGSCTFSAGVVTCNVGSLAPGASGTFTVTVMASTDTSACSAIHNGNYTIQGDEVGLTLGPIVTTPILGACLAAPISMVGWWPLDEPAGTTAHDVVAGHPGTHQGTLPIARVTGHVGQSLDLDGAGQYVLVPHPPDGALDFGPETGSDSRDFSIDAWIRPDPDTGYRAIVWKGIKQTYALGLRDDRLSLVLRSANGVREAVSASIPTLTDGQWHLVAVTVDRDGGMTGGALVRFYFDGALIHTESLAPLAGSISSSEGFAIGFAHPGGFVQYSSQSFDGAIDEVEVFPYVLDATAILGIWLANEEGKCQRWCSVPTLKGMCATDTFVVVPVEIHNPSAVAQTYVPSGDPNGLPAGFQFGAQTSTVEGPGIFTASFSSPSVFVPAGSVGTVDLTLNRPAGFAVQGARAAYRVTISGTDGVRQCVGVLLDARNHCFGHVNVGHPASPVGVTHRKPFTVDNTTGVPKVFDLRWRVEDSEGASDTKVVSLGTLPPGEPLTRTVVVPPGTTLFDELVFTPLVHDGVRTFDIVLQADLDGDGEPEPVDSAGLRTTLPAAEVMPGRLAIVTAGKLTVTGKAARGTTFVLPDASDDPRIEGGALEVFDTGGTGFTVYSLPAGGWRGYGQPPGAKGYRYRGTGLAGDPCRTVSVKNKVVKALCKGPDVTLTTPFVGEAGIVFTIGTDSLYCTRFGGTTVRNDAAGFKRKDALAADRCAAPNP